MGNFASLDECYNAALAYNANFNDQTRTLDGYTVKNTYSNYVHYVFIVKYANSNPDAEKSGFAFYTTASGSTQSCPSSHPIDNGDGTCSIDGAHEAFCQDLANSGTSFWAPDNGDECTTITDGNPQGYSCTFTRGEIGIGFGGGVEQWEYTASGEICSGGGSGGNSPGSDPLEPSTPIDGGDLGGDGGSPGTTPGTDPAEPTNDESASYLGQKIEFETRTQTNALLDGMAESVNKRNENHDKNSQFIVQGLSDLAKANASGLSDIERAVRANGTSSGGGSGGGDDPAGWGNEENVSIDALDCTPDPVTGRCTNWQPLTEQELPEQIINLDQEISQFDEYSVTATCPETLPMALSFGNLDFNSKPVCDSLGGVRYILLAIAYFIVARVMVRSFG
ncbi:hypothetical protein IDAT_01055 [Pseudidiomarina atlantica]|uniref:Uncharacterized protein n=2 Tax=Pseudidiomarina atlantica TaxID=1517416 RepID=A0A094IRG4_9GAMM|nr:hypothetical protein IDAT_01055 [Pseudidiomarina atlantica]